MPSAGTKTTGRGTKTKQSDIIDSWEKLGLSQSIIETVKEANFQTMTSVQSATIPLFLGNKDVAVEAVTGSGKTLAFVIPILEILLRREATLKKHEIGALIITPTRELAIQIDEVLSTFLKRLPQFTQLLMIGGVSPALNVEKFLSSGGNIIVATPGRLEDLFNRQQDGFSLPACVKSLEVLVLDEADRLLSMGFDLSINAILSYLPKQRRTGLFSATQTDELEALLRAGLRNPVRITVREKPNSAVSQRTPLKLDNYYTVCQADRKFDCLVAFLRKHRRQKHMVFLSTCAAVEYFAHALGHLLKNTVVSALHRKLKEKRNKIFSAFRDVNSGILVCTDVMARGVDIPEVHWVLQYDPPSQANAFVHRCGRTARIGNSGSALLFLLPTEESYVDFIALNQKVPLQFYDTSRLELVSTLPRLRRLNAQDRAVYDKGMQAFVSFIRAYSKHDCQLIFRLKDLDFGQLANCFGLLRLPKMPELKGRDTSAFVAADTDLDQLKYRDKAREKLRLVRKARAEAEGAERRSRRSVKPQNVSWSKQKERKQKKLKRQQLQGKRKRHQFDKDELAELARDARLVKKLKKGKISSQKFEQEFVDKDTAASGQA